MKRSNLAACVELALCLACTTASAQSASGPPPDDDLSGKFICRSQSLTLCQDEFCFVSFDDPANEPMFFDFQRQTYQFPAVSPDTRPMKMAGVERTRQHYAAKFTMELKNGPSNVQFIANRKDDGTLVSSAAGRIVYPATAERSQITAINGMACEKNAN